MRRLLVLTAGLVLLASGCTRAAGVAGAGPDAGARAAAGWSAATWSAVRVLPVTLPVVPSYIQPTLTSLSCGSQGNCVVLGTKGKVTPPTVRFQVLAISEAEGSWRSPRVISGTGAAATSLSCSAIGSCLATETASGLDSQVLVAIQQHGAWTRMRPLPGLAALAGRGGGSAVDAQSCDAAGTCVVAGHYWPASAAESQQRSRLFAVTEHDGTWRTVQTVSGPAVSAMTCDPAGTCTAVGSLAVQPGPPQLVAREYAGTWGQPQVITGAPGGSGAAPSITAIACAAPGSCSAVGVAGANGTHARPLVVVTQTAGTWGRVVVLPGLPVVPGQPDNLGGSYIAGISCAAPGDCGLAGFTSSVSYGEHGNVRASVAFVASQVHGRWTAAQLVPGLTALSHGVPAAVGAISCAAPGDCAVGGSYGGPDGNAHAWLAIQANGTWGRAVAVPGLAALGRAAAEVTFLACGPGAHQSGGTAGGCTAAGDFYTKIRGRYGLYKAHFFATAFG